MADTGNASRARSDSDARQERNLVAIERLAHATRLGASVLVAVGLLGLVGWVWRVIRAQVDALNYSGLGFAFDDAVGAPSLSIMERLDLFVMSLDSLVYSVLAIAVALFLRAAADYMVACAGGSLPRLRPRHEEEWPTS